MNNTYFVYRRRFLIASFLIAYGITLSLFLKGVSFPFLIFSFVFCRSFTMSLLERISYCLLKVKESTYSDEENIQKIHQMTKNELDEFFIVCARSKNNAAMCVGFSFMIFTLIGQGSPYSLLGMLLLFPWVPTLPKKRPHFNKIENGIYDFLRTLPWHMNPVSGRSSATKKHRTTRHSSSSPFHKRGGSSSVRSYSGGSFSSGISSSSGRDRSWQHRR